MNTYNLKRNETKKKFHISIFRLSSCKNLCITTLSVMLRNDFSLLGQRPSTHPPPLYTSFKMNGFPNGVNSTTMTITLWGDELSFFYNFSSLITLKLCFIQFLWKHKMSIQNDKMLFPRICTFNGFLAVHCGKWTWVKSQQIICGLQSMQSLLKCEPYMCV